MKKERVEQTYGLSNPEILVCLPFHGKRAELLNTVLLKLLEQDYPKQKTYLFLVDNMSEAPVAKVANNFLKSFGSRYWKYDIARTKKNVVYMRNLGIIKANSLKCRYIFHLDSDVHLKPNSISNLVKILQADDGIFSACQEFLVPLKDEGFIFGTKRKYANFSTLDKRELVDVENVAMGATLFRLALLNKVGLLDERVPMIEDLNIHKKARNLGYREDHRSIRLCQSPR